MALIAILLVCTQVGLAQIQERFPKPDFESGYVRPDLLTPSPRAAFLEYMDLFVLLAALSLAVYFALKQRSRKNLFFLMILSLIYFGFIRRGCVCSVGAVQNVSLALFNPAYAIPIGVIVFFVLPLIFTLFFGRTFCAAVCPLGAIQDAVVLKPIKVPGMMADLLGLIPYLYLGLAILLAATGAGFIICQYDPFIGFFRFGADFNMVIFGLSLLLLGTVVARPYCRFLCPYGVLLNWMSRLARRHVKITPSECNNCRLCEDSCPFGAIKKANTEASEVRRESDVKWAASLFVLLPVVLVASGWIGSRLDIPLSRIHPTVSLAEEILMENAGRRTEMTDPAKAFRASGKTTEELYAEAAAIRSKIRKGGWLLGGFVGLALWFKLFGLLVRRGRPEYEIDRGACFSCGRCFSYCPYEQVRLGLMTPEELKTLDKRDVPIKQFRA